ncbi:MULTISPECIES: DUF4238 domain-containing protein [unclassified Chryseobacterium]|uniref:DUF4238 domain-containing protein n=1 Tax=unclassified Chryseobacterium TaxID=2593645 RepID=UPI00100C2B8C|nr:MULTISPECIES: DUF4238 domain-containing protein [unclassified Chryseobacterium]RXM53279.1 hypothetical protein BOQ64_02570 [Chryseobacterium sp. CH25]RXM65523.1 hypothetical protein BOQ60_06920 [Chryseobacterium sp. CH1]
MEKETHIYQHYIPECYLKNFTIDDKGLFVYRKDNNSKVFPQSISNIAGEKRFYDIDDKFLLEEFKGKNKFIETEIFANCFEPVLSNLLQKIGELCHNWDKRNIYNNVLDDIELDNFAELIAIQYIRHPNFIEKYWQFHKEMYLKRTDIIRSFLLMANSKFKNENKLNLEFDEDYSSALHSNFILDNEWRYDIQNQLVKKIWIFYYTNNNVVTSDNPILLKPHLNKQASFFEGFGKKGVEIIFPINKNLILTILDEEYFSEQKDLHNTIQFLNEKKLREYNLHQYCFSNYEVYSASNNFEIIKKFVELNNGIDYFPIKPKINVY